jgi:hypothetical protein
VKEAGSLEQAHVGEHITTRQYGRLVDDWVALTGLDPAAYGTHSLRRTKVALVYKANGQPSGVPAPARPR